MISPDRLAFTWRAAASTWRPLIVSGLVLIAAGMWIRILARDTTGGSVDYRADELEYVLFMAEELDLLGMELTEAGYLLQAPDMESAKWRADVATEAEKVSASAHRIHARKGPGRFQDSGEVIGLAMVKYIDAMSLVEPALLARDEDLIDRAFAETLEAGEVLSHATAGGGE